MVTRHRHRQRLFGLWCAVPADRYGVGSADEIEVEVASSGHIYARRIVSSPFSITPAMLGLGMMLAEQ